MNKMDKEELRQELLERMCWIAEEMHRINNPAKTGEAIMVLGVGIVEQEKRPVAFKPGIGDRFLFKLILNQGALDNIYKEFSGRVAEYSDTNELIMGASILENFYYPQYSEFDRQQLEQAKHRNI